jgi:quinol monooxygenase YgiN
MARITFVSRMTVKEGREEEFVQICKDLARTIHEKEKDVIYYEFFKLREPRRYAVLESFPSEEVEHAHMTSPWLAAAAPGLVDCLEGTWVREYLDPLP